MTALTEVDLTLPSGAPIMISCQRGDEYRAERLFRVAHFLDLNNAVPIELTRLHDHAGILRPCWRALPRDGRVIRVIAAAWNAEREQLVWHMLGSDPRGAPFLEDEVRSPIKPSPGYNTLRAPAPAAMASPFVNGPRPPSDE